AQIGNVPDLTTQCVIRAGSFGRNRRWAGRRAGVRALGLLEAGKAQPAEAAGAAAEPAEAAAEPAEAACGPEPRRRHLLRRPDRLVDRGHDHVLEHLDVLGIDGVGVDLDLADLEPAGDLDLHHAAAGAGLDDLGLELLL